MLDAKRITELARIADVDEAVIVAFERGKAVPTPATMTAIGQAIDRVISPAEYMDLLHRWLLVHDDSSGAAGNLPR